MVANNTYNLGETQTYYLYIFNAKYRPVQHLLFAKTDRNFLTEKDSQNPYIFHIQNRKRRRNS